MIVSAHPLPPLAGLRTGVTLVDRSAWGRLRLSGTDVADLLNRLSTNLVAALAAGSGLATVIVTNKGRIVDWVRLFALADGSHLLLTSPGQSACVAAWIDLYLFTEEVTVVDESATGSLVGVFGRDATEALLAACVAGGQIPTRPGDSTIVRIGDSSAVLMRADLAGVPEIVVLADDATVTRLAGALEAAGAAWVGVDAVERLRISCGVPAMGSELGEQFNPLEARLQAFVHFTKGCYVGQEVIARLHNYDKVKRLLMVVCCNRELHPGDALLFDGQEVGQVTSAASRPEGGWVGLAYIATRCASPGLEVGVAGRGAVATMSDPPFLLGLPS
ncbi:MAG: hypothetical protein HYV63_01915 [Candidatus Schekmanbacteria bacterium]|nr:hypothetical protein [Candidatus Schekmanbacteria bacterium]